MKGRTGEERRDCAYPKQALAGAERAALASSVHRSPASPPPSSPPGISMMDPSGDEYPLAVLDGMLNGFGWAQRASAMPAPTLNHTLNCDRPTC